MMFNSFFFVASGGALGACLRHAVSLACAPLGLLAGVLATLLVNVAGSLVLGLFVAWGLSRPVDPPVSLFFGVGVLGALTTFSAFSRETIMLSMQGTLLQAGAFVLANLVGGIGAFALGFFLLRRILS